MTISKIMCLNSINLWPTRYTAVLWTLVWTLLSIGQAMGAARQYLKKTETWFASAEAKSVAVNILSYQSDLGGWPKNVDTATAPYTGKDRAKDLKPTFDNGATTDELHFLARIFKATKDETYNKAFIRGLDYILKAQYPTGGWPQFYPPSTQYHRHITFNDNAMVRLMNFLRETYTSDVYAFIDAERKKAARKAFDDGIQCILKCQIKTNGKLTAWCAQHDENDYSPRSGRKYELVSLSGAESVGIVEFLMSLEQPSAEIVQAIDGAVAWFQLVKISGLRETQQKDDQAPKGKNKVMVQDPSAPPLWARFYEINSNRPMFVDRDGVPKYKLADIGYERRNGYGWYGNWPQALLDKKYPAWKAKLH